MVRRAMPPMSRFERDTAVEPLGSGRYGARMDPGWWIVNGPNGGYLAAVLMRAMQAEIGDPARTPRALTIHYLRPPAEGEAQVQVTCERQGRTVSNLSARLSQSGKLQLLATAAFSNRTGGISFQDAEMPEVPPPAEVTDAGPPRIRMHERYDRRWLWGSHEGGHEQAVCGGWIRLAEPCAPDFALIAALTDAWPPSIFQRPLDREGRGTPTLDLTIHFRSDPCALAAGDWVLARFQSRTARDGFVEEDGELWSPDGTLLAHSRQLAVLT
jgi:acyl-CoA thioesterase